ncbi:MAG TPA: B12-binding domain-containing protein [Thermoleophilaceae bacterium]|nr:B12-binding domain-containing protein [Thermoleophilaceae bacterium]
MERGHDEFRKRVLAESLSERFGVALVQGDSAEAEQIAQEALELTLGEALLYELVVGPAMHRIGRLWASGEISVAHEHLATQIATQVLVLAHHAEGLPDHRAAQRPRPGSVPAAVDAVTGAADDICVVLGGASVPPSLGVRPRVVVERSVAGVVDAADGLVRRAGLN